MERLKGLLVSHFAHHVEGRFCVRLVECAEERSRAFHEVKRLDSEEPGSKEYWQAYCAFIEAEAAFDAAMARADKANGDWKLRVVE